MGDKSYNKSIGNIDMENNLETADNLFKEERYSEAEVIYQELYDRSQSAEALFGLVLCSYQKGDYAQSLNYIDALLTVDPDHVGAFNQAGVIAYAMEDWESAKSLFQAAIKRAPDYVTSQRNYAEVLLKMGDYDNGCMVFMKILQHHPNDIPAMTRLVQLNAEAGCKEDAINWATKVLACDPLNEEARSFLTKYQDDLETDLNEMG